MKRLKLDCVNMTEESLIGDGGPTPAGGWAKGVGIDIKWQGGPIGDGQPTGAQCEEVLECVKNRLQFFQEICDRKFACRENALAITKIEEALHWLDHRTLDRERRKVEGKNEV